MKRTALLLAFALGTAWSQHTPPEAAAAPLATAAALPAPAPSAASAATPAAAAIVREPLAYVLQPLDDLEIRAYNIPQLNAAMKIRPDGKITPVLLDDIQAAGRTVEQLSDTLDTKYAEHFRNPKVTVMVKSFSSQTVYVGGEVMKPGAIPLRSGLTATQAVVEAGGLKDSTSGDQVVVVHDANSAARRTETLNLSAVLLRKAPDPILKPTDMVYVQRSYLSVYVGGEVAKPGLVPLAGNMSILAAVLQAGGFKESAKTNSVILIRDSGKGTPLISKLKVNDVFVASAHTMLQPYDVVYVPKTRIARIDKFIDQWVRQLSPAILSFGFSYLLGQGLGAPIF